MNNREPQYTAREQAEDLERLKAAKDVAFGLWRHIRNAEEQLDLEEDAKKDFLGSPEVSPMAEVAGLVEGLAGQTRSLWEALAVAYEQFAESRQRAQAYLADRSWFLSHSVTHGELIQLVRMIENKDDVIIEGVMCGIANRARDTAEQRLVRLFSNRARILKQAFEAHRQDRFALSVPVMLSQAEGIGLDIFARKRVFRQRDASEIQRAINAKLSVFQLSSDEIILTFVSQAYESNRIKQSSSDLEKLGYLNRHAVLHGYDVRYATEQNSLRCILLLDFLADLHLVLYDEGTA